MEQGGPDQTNPSLFDGPVVACAGLEWGGSNTTDG